MPLKDIPDSFYTKALDRAVQRKMTWYQKNLVRILQEHKEKQVPDIDKSIYIAKKLMKALKQKVATHITVPPIPYEPSDAIDAMRPVDPEVSDILYRRANSGVKVYLKERYKTRPEDRYNLRLTSNQDYGWLQSKIPPSRFKINFGRRNVLMDSMFRRNNCVPDSPETQQPCTNDNSVCGQSQCVNV